MPIAATLLLPIILIIVLSIGLIIAAAVSFMSGLALKKSDGRAKTAAFLTVILPCVLLQMAWGPWFVIFVTAPDLTPASLLPAVFVSMMAGGLFGLIQGWFFVRVFPVVLKRYKAHRSASIKR